MLLFFLLILTSACKQSQDLVIDPNIKTIPVTDVELAYQIDAKLGEGAYWNHHTQKLWWVDIEGKTFNILDPDKGDNSVHVLPSRIGTVVPSSTGSAILGTEEGIVEFVPSNRVYKIISDVESNIEETRLNDGKCDPSGRFWVGSMHLEQKEGRAKLFNINTEGELQIKIDSVTISNGIVWTSDKSIMYYIDTPTSQIKAYDYNDGTGEISNGRVAVEIEASLGFPDGMAIDENNMLWVGMWNGNAVIQCNPKTGKVIQKIAVPAHNVTSCAFGGDNLDILYITTARIDMTEDELVKYPNSGSLFKVIPGVKGVKSTFYKDQSNI